MQKSLLEEYLELEKAMLNFDKLGEERAAENARVQMDDIWYQLSDAALSWLSSRDMTDA